MLWVSMLLVEHDGDGAQMVLMSLMLMLTLMMLIQTAVEGGYRLDQVCVGKWQNGRWDRTNKMR